MFPITDNVRLQTYYRSPFARGIVSDEKAIHAEAQKLVEEYDVRTPSVRVNIGSLSGGNQQKAIVAREFTRPNRLLIVAQPTRGVDVGSIEFIHNQIVRMRDNGTAVLLVSTELDEILSLSDRIAVMYAGEIVAILDADEADRERIGLLMAGVREDKKGMPDG
jgi:simple sugar transport system ATP-binding protein